LEPPPVITSRLYPHQQQALAWMVHRESNEVLPPFWELMPQEPGKPVVWANTLTKFESTTRPAAVR
jgi:SWI/SNF-related matrix-associated actin-dependent regulator of chromatin subfamily A3